MDDSLKCWLQKGIWCHVTLDHDIFEEIEQIYEKISLKKC